MLIIEVISFYKVTALYVLIKYDATAKIIPVSEGPPQHLVSYSVKEIGSCVKEIGSCTKTEAVMKVESTISFKRRKLKRNYQHLILSIRAVQTN